MVKSLSEALGLSDECRVVTMAVPPYTIMHTNKAWSRLTGFKFTEVANRSNYFLQGPHTEPDIVQKLHKSIASGKPTSVRMINYTKMGEPFYNSLRVHPLRDLHGRITHFCGVLQGEPVPQGLVPPLVRGEDVLSAPEPLAAKVEEEEEEAAAASIRVHALPSIPSPQLTGTKRARLASTTSLHDAIDNTKDAVVLTQARPPYAITHVNAPWCEMCGYSLEEVEGQTNSILHGPDTDEALLAYLMASVRRGESSSATLVNYKKGGKRFVNQVSIHPVYNDHEEIDQFMAMLREVDSKPPAGTEAGTAVCV